MIITIIFFRQMAHIFLPFFRQIIIHFNIEFSSFFWRQNGSIFNDTHKSIDRCRLKKVSLILTFINFFPRMKIFLFKKLNNTSFFVWNSCDNTGFNPNSLMAAWFFKHHNELKLVEKSFHFLVRPFNVCFKQAKEKSTFRAESSANWFRKNYVQFDWLISKLN